MQQLLLKHDQHTNRVFMICYWISLAAVTPIILTVGDKLGIDRLMFALWAAGAASAGLLMQILLWLHWLPNLQKYLTVTMMSGALMAMSFVVPGASHHLGTWYVGLAFAAFYANRRVAVYTTAFNLVGWLIVCALRPPVTGDTVLLLSVIVVNGILIAVVGAIIITLSNRFRSVFVSLAAATAQEEVVTRLDGLVAQARTSAQTLAATAVTVNEVSQQTARYLNEALAPVVAELQAESLRSEQSVAGTLQAMEVLTQTVAQVARSAEDQANRVTASAEVTESMSQASRAVTELANNVHRDASGATTAAAAGSETVTRNATGMEALSRAMESAAANLEALGARSEQIGEVVTTINSFAGQTNLLALNAAIEAARAGEAGRGFAVVAQEVRTLSEQSTKATNEIAALIAEVQTGIRESVAGMRMATRQTADSMGLSRAAGASLEQIQAAVGETTKRVSEILGQSERLDGHSHELVSTISELAAMTEENSAAAAEIAKVSEEVLGNARQLGNDAKARAEAAAKVLSATQGITELIAKLTASAGTLDHLAADLAAATGSAA